MKQVFGTILMFFLIGEIKASSFLCASSCTPGPSCLTRCQEWLAHCSRGINLVSIWQQCFYCKIGCSNCCKRRKQMNDVVENDDDEDERFQNELDVFTKRK